MYEQKDVPVVRRILWLGLWLIVIIAVVWVAVWLIFFRNGTSDKPATPISQPTHQNQPVAPKTGSSSKTSNNTGNTSGSNSTPSANTTQQTPTTSTTNSSAAPPSQLANTGPGNALLPAGAAAVIASTFYYIRLRKKVVH